MLRRFFTTTSSISATTPSPKRMHTMFHSSTTLKRDWAGHFFTRATMSPPQKNHPSHTLDMLYKMVAIDRERHSDAVEKLTLRLKCVAALEHAILEIATDHNHINSNYDEPLNAEQQRMYSTHLYLMRDIISTNKNFELLAGNEDLISKIVKVAIRNYYSSKDNNPSLINKTEAPTTPSPVKSSP